MRRPGRSLALLGLLTLAAVGSAHPAVAGGEAPTAPIPPGDAADSSDAIARTLEATNLRMKAALERAAILGRLGRTDDALRALAEVEAIHREGLAAVDRLRTPRRVPVVAPPRAPSRPTAPPPQEPPPRAPTRGTDLVAKAREFLAAAQDASGFFRPDPNAPAVDPTAGPDGARIRTTALAVVALLDAVGTERTPAASLDAAGRGVAALLGLWTGDRGFRAAEDVESHALVTWAVAAGCASLPDASWRVQARGVLGIAVARLLALRAEDGLWRAGTGRDADDWVVSAWAVTALREVEALPTSFARDVDLESVFARAREGDALRFSATLLVDDDAARFARTLLTGPERRGIGDLPLAPVDDVAALFGTVLKYSWGAGFDDWDRNVLQPLAGRQVPLGRGAGWAPRGRRSADHGRVYATALNLLTVLVPETEHRVALGD